MRITDDVDYVAEVARSRNAQGLAAEVPKHVRDAVAALLAADEHPPESDPNND